MGDVQFPSPAYGKIAVYGLFFKYPRVQALCTVSIREMRSGRKMGASTCGWLVGGDGSVYCG